MKCEKARSLLEVECDDDSTTSDLVLKDIHRRMSHELMNTD